MPQYLFFSGKGGAGKIALFATTPTTKVYLQAGEVKGPDAFKKLSRIVFKGEAGGMAKISYNRSEKIRGSL